MMATVIEGEAKLSDGRVLGYAAFGAESGPTLLYFHGTLGSRLEARLFDDEARRLGLRVIGVDRPGHGLSSQHPERTFASWVGDVRELADLLGLDRFGVMGLSGGGGHAAVVASALGQRLTRVAIFSGVGPPEAPATGRALAVRLSIWGVRWVVGLHMRLLAMVLGFCVRRWGPRFFALVGRVASGGDGRALALPEVRRVFADSWREGVRQGSRGATLDLQVQLRAWNLPLTVPACAVDLWYGQGDTTNPPAIAQWFAQVWPHSTLHLLDDEGHLLVFTHVAEVLAPFA